MPEILPNQVTLAARRQTAALLESKLSQPIEKFDDLIDRLQLALVADLDPDLARRTGEQILRAVQALTTDSRLVELGGDQGHNPQDYFAASEWESLRRPFYELEQALLPLRGSAMLARGQARDQILQRAIAALRLHQGIVRRILLGLRQTHERRLVLRAFVRSQMMNKNRGQILVNVTDRAASLVRGTHAPARHMLADLFAVLIGDNMLEGRLSGQYFATNLNGAAGFLPEYRDPFNQIQHAIAGVIIGARTGPFGSAFVVAMETLRWQPQDRALYQATCWIGMTLTDGNYQELSEQLRLAICDATVTPAP